MSTRTFTIIKVFDDSVENIFLEYSKAKVKDEYLLHYTCGHKTRDKELIKQHYCEKCHVCVDYSQENL